MVYETVQGKWKMKMENGKCLLPLWYSVFFFLIDVCFSVFVKEEWAILFLCFPAQPWHIGIQCSFEFSLSRASSVFE